MLPNLNTKPFGSACDACAIGEGIVDFVKAALEGKTINQAMARITDEIGARAAR